VQAWGCFSIFPDVAGLVCLNKITMWKVQLYKTNYDEREYEAALRALKSGWHTMGQETIGFEAAFADYLGKHNAGDSEKTNLKCLAVANGTAALHMALLACGVGQGDEVITPALTFIADQNTVSFCGAKNVLADITSLDDLTMSPAEIEKQISPATKAIMIVHYAGFACDMDSITALCKKHKLYLIEDCAHTPGATYKSSDGSEKHLGTFGDIAAFSFFANKNLAMGEGGGLVTSNDALYTKLLHLRSHGMSQASFDRFKGRASSYDVLEPGLNYRIDEMRTAIGLVQLNKLDAANAERAEVAKHYYNRLDTLAASGKITIPFRHYKRGRPNHHIMPIILNEQIERSAVIEAMKEDGIQTSIHYPAVQGFSAYKGRVNDTAKAQFVCTHELTLPLYAGMQAGDVDMVCDSLGKAIKTI
jgi:dTDP-4-amino-4,6-dideoxygalactose transaminase